MMHYMSKTCLKYGSVFCFHWLDSAAIPVIGALVTHLPWPQNIHCQLRIARLHRVQCIKKINVSFLHTFLLSTFWE